MALEWRDFDDSLVGNSQSPNRRLAGSRLYKDGSPVDMGTASRPPDGFLSRVYTPSTRDRVLKEIERDKRVIGARYV